MEIEKVDGVIWGHKTWTCGIEALQCSEEKKPPKPPGLEQPTGREWSTQRLSFHSCFYSISPHTPYFLSISRSFPCYVLNSFVYDDLRFEYTFSQFMSFWYFTGFAFYQSIFTFLPINIHVFNQSIFTFLPINIHFLPINIYILYQLIFKFLSINIHFYQSIFTFCQSIFIFVSTNQYSLFTINIHFSPINIHSFLPINIHFSYQSIFAFLPINIHFSYQSIFTFLPISIHFFNQSIFTFFYQSIFIYPFGQLTSFTTRIIYVWFFRKPKSFNHSKIQRLDSWQSWSMIRPPDSILVQKSGFKKMRGKLIITPQKHGTNNVSYFTPTQLDHGLDTFPLPQYALWVERASVLLQ